MKQQLYRPPFSDIASSLEFNRWYWLKSELTEICKTLGIPSTGTKFELRDWIAYALDHQGALQPKATKVKPTSSFNWAKADLSPQTVITANVSFGPNFRRFMRAQLGNQFSCHADFMDWVRSNTGKTLGDAVVAWQQLDKRKKDPGFRRIIRKHNRYNQYIRDFLEDNPGRSLAEARKYWNLKKQLPAENGLVIYEPSDLKRL